MRNMFEPEALIYMCNTFHWHVSEVAIPTCASLVHINWTVEFTWLAAIIVYSLLICGLWFSIFIVFVSWYTFTVESCVPCWRWHTSCCVIFLQICHAVKSQGFVPVRDSEGRIGPYVYKGNQWVSYDDVSDIRRKVCAVQVLSFCGMWHWIAGWVVADVLKEGPWRNHFLMDLEHLKTIATPSFEMCGTTYLLMQHHIP